MEDWRFFVIVIILTLGVVDLIATYYYVQKYKAWQPDKPYKLIELNPLLTLLWNKLGLIIGMIVGAAIMLSLQYIVAKEAHWIVVCLLLVFLAFAMYNHIHNIDLLNKLIDRYPSGYLPVQTFGNVIGNNLK